MKRALLIFWLVACQFSGLGCQSLKLWDKKAEVDDDDDDGPIKTSYIADEVNIAGLHPITVEGVGLVVGLDNTGENPPPSQALTILLEDMKRRGVKDPRKMFESQKVAMVLIRAAIPPVIQYGDRFDVEVVLPEGTNATSLAGGWLREADLAERFEPVPGRIQKGHILAKCLGPVMVAAGEGSKDSQASLLKRGKVLGGAVYLGGLLKEDRKVGLYLRSDFKSKRQTTRIADRIAHRFHYHEKGIKKGMATAKTDQHIELKVHPRYKENYYRYLQVIRRIAMNETPVQQRRRIEKLRRELLDPDKASISALELEAIGKDGIPILKEGLQSSIFEVQFYAADALAYLEDPSGVEVLAKAARDEPAFRVFALTSLSNLEGVANEHLKEIMNDKSAEARYGAFHTLKAIDKQDPFLAREKINDQFSMYLLRTKGEPMVHLTKHNVSEVVLFGTEQRLQPPFALEAGRHILVTAQAGSDTVTLSRFTSNKKKVVSTRLADVIRALGELDATYPDTAQMLTQAKAASCLESRLEFDALPQGGRIYHRPMVANNGMTAPASKTTKIGTAERTPNLVPTVEENRGHGSADENPDAAPAQPEQRSEDRLASHTRSEPSQPEKPPTFLERMFPKRNAPDGKPREPKRESTPTPDDSRTPQPNDENARPSQNTESASRGRSRAGRQGGGSTSSTVHNEPAIDQVVFDESEPAADPVSTSPKPSGRSGNRRSAPASGTDSLLDTQ